MSVSRSRVLRIDALINFLLGGALRFFPFTAVWLGIPEASSSFYPTILGGVLFGIGIALAWEARRGEGQAVGLGLAGAVAINLCGGVVLTIWLANGGLNIPLRGQIILWSLALALVLISLAELRLPPA